MNKQESTPQRQNGGIIIPPAYPFTGRALLSELRSMLSEELQEPMTYDRMAQIMGRPKASAHFWLDQYNHPHLSAYMCLLERLSPPQRDAFIERHCRPFPTLGHPRLSHSPAGVGQLSALLEKTAGLTIVAGADGMRTFVLTALGHAHRRSGSRRHAVAGLDLHRPSTFVPVPTVIYIDPALGPKRVRQLSLEVWPRILTGGASLLLCNGVWSAVPEVREDLVRCAASQHVVVAEAGVPDLAALRKRVSTPIHVVTIFAAKCVSGGIRLDCRRIKAAKRP